MVTALLLAGCGADIPDGTADTASPAATGAAEPVAEVDREELVAIATAAAIDLRADGCSSISAFGSGSMISENLALTAAHVVAGSDGVEVVDVDGQRTAADVVLFDPDLDLAVVRTADPVGRPLALRPEDPRVGEVGVVALPRWEDGELDLRVADVEVIRTVNISTTDIYLDADVDRPGFKVTASIDPGDSGGIVVLPGGGAGLIWARSLDDEARAWGIDLPAVLFDSEQLAALVDPVDTQRCS